MSVINKMLQDLDARQHAGREAAPLYTKPAALRERRLSPLLIAGASAAAALLAVAVMFGWRQWHNARPVPAAPVPAKVVVAPAPPKVAMLPPPAADAQGPARGDAAAPPGERATARSAGAEPPAPAPAAARPAAPAQVVKAAGDAAASAALAPRESRGARTRPVEKAAAATASKSGAGKVETAAQRAEAAYRSALGYINDGYTSDAIAALEQALQADPRHDAARQTLVGLLIENRQAGEAMRQLERALAVDPRQPSMAMLLARLQIEHGASGVDTLMRTLPYVGANGEYHAFLAGALQRQQRHREAIEQYQAALRALPQNGVWLMGLGISLQADKRDGEALDAFRRARASGTLAPQLGAFVDGRIQQLSR